MNLLMIDNYDSFTYNLVHYIESNPYNAGIKVVTPDQLNDKLIEEFNIIGLIISPGPSHPKDRPEVLEFVKNHYKALPILGICLGHQMLWHMFGGEVSRGERPVHGHAYDVHHNGEGLYKNLPSPVKGCRYHSLTCYGELEEFNITGRTEMGINMAIQHKNLPVFGVQYHPEAILSEHGRAQLNNFIRIAVEESHESTYKI
ncbi:glutamine amidotransferase [Jeotgalicoccus coquinae]|uniref:Aminodeoxychorismate/anthranilate synthase component 2 n=1 Tax=Jeotgalicoccus coquinae TaxID=709509 RepID=A0A6V7RND5_9STAP|nr:aminodeoxychorismate/anthranilate synthase component II [Jeotgalicoccus coquinae]MBB6422254.1 anthranilate synthase/aminodeoxychorismate synthase-like glutamine amidotransferase [Jeotgalicoccus coquinae]GGE17394.1 glutamine amidotransferase [Jeotgalicoccus coquinae]CAD2079174.1 Aminodeoxychorismate/anthranilate synthase component 2 [Jeotgalicoccus coquinae]